MKNQFQKKAERVLITGANGFIGRELCTQAFRHGWQVRVALRRVNQLPLVLDRVTVNNIDNDTDWAQALQNVHVVIHLAGHAHAVGKSANHSLADFRSINVDGTLNLARQAANTGIRRFIFISSIKVNGEKTQAGHPYTALDQPAPADPYGISKYEAENALREFSGKTGMEVVIIRPPLVYGPGVHGNFLNMMRWLNMSLPLPLASIKNKRSLVSLDNLVDLIITCISHPAAANQTFLAGDGEDLSTAELLQRTARALGKKAWLLPVPVWLLRFCFGLVGKHSEIQKLCDSLQVDINMTCEQLGWAPPSGVDESLNKTAREYLREHQ